MSVDPNTRVIAAKQNPRDLQRQGIVQRNSVQDMKERLDMEKRMGTQ